MEEIERDRDEIFREKSQSDDKIRVCCRFRPLNAIEKGSKGEESVVEIVDDFTLKIKKPGGIMLTEGRKDGGSVASFNYDHVFKDFDSQEKVFNIVAKPMVSEVLNGYNATIFAYGQTGSGKTHTIMGYNEAGIKEAQNIGDGEEKTEKEQSENYDGEVDSTFTTWEKEEEMGIVPRLVKAIFESIANADDNIEFTVQVSYVEIYLEKIRDLLNPVNDNLKIREHSNHGVYIEGVSEFYVGDFEEVLEIMRRGEINRSVAATRMNKKSSRSHSVFIMTLTQSDRTTDSKKISKLIIVDLAGSEKVRKTGAEGLTLLQAQHTNKSLAALGLVINSLTEGKPHIPYRDSKLTRLLTDSLGGNSKTCLVITCSMAEYNLEETFSTLRFGARAKTIKNKPKVNQERSVEEYKKLLSAALKKNKKQLALINLLQTNLDKLMNYAKKNGLEIKEEEFFSSNIEGGLKNESSSNKSKSEKSFAMKEFLNSQTIEDLKSQIENLKREIDENTNDIDDYREQISRRDSDIEALKIELLELSEDKSDLNSKLKAKEQIEWEMKETLSKQKFEIKTLERKQAEQTVLIKELKKNVEKLKNGDELSSVKKAEFIDREKKENDDQSSDFHMQDSPVSAKLTSDKNNKFSIQIGQFSPRSMPAMSPRYEDVSSSCHNCSKLAEENEKLKADNKNLIDDMSEKLKRFLKIQIQNEELKEYFDNREKISNIGKLTSENENDESISESVSVDGLVQKIKSLQDDNIRLSMEINDLKFTSSMDQEKAEELEKNLIEQTKWNEQVMKKLSSMSNDMDSPSTSAGIDVDRALNMHFAKYKTALEKLRTRNEKLMRNEEYSHMLLKSKSDHIKELESFLVEANTKLRLLNEEKRKLAEDNAKKDQIISRINSSPVIMKRNIKVPVPRKGQPSSSLFRFQQ